MSNYNKLYFSTMKSFIEAKEQEWRNKTISNKEALEFFKEKHGEICFFLSNYGQSEVKRNFVQLGLYVQNLIKEIKEEMKTIYILKTDDNKIISISDNSLLQKCIARLGNEVEVFKMKICETEEDLDDVLEEGNL